MTSRPKKDDLLPQVDPLKRYHDEDWHTPRGRAIREVVFGANDGLITTVGFLAGVTGAIKVGPLVVVAGLAEVVAGAISMAFGAYLSTKSQREFFETEIARERREIEEMPEKEREEIREIYTEYGFEPDEVEMIVNRVTSDKDLWVRFMMKDELGIGREAQESPLGAGATMGLSFILGSIPPFVPYLVFSNPRTALVVSVGVSLATLFAIGGGKTILTKGSALRSGLEMMLLGATAAAIGFGIGGLIGGWIG